MKTSRILILGMHRSGTSCLAGSLQAAGVYLGNVQQENKFNFKGNRENYEFMRLNDDLLAYNHTTWDDPSLSLHPLRWADELRYRRDYLLEKLEQEAISAGYIYWGFKDPRTLLTFEFWNEKELVWDLIGSIRHPYAVLESLKARDHKYADRALDLWKKYNLRLLYLAESKRVKLINFDLDKFSYRNKINSLFSSLGLNECNKAMEFYDANLIHNSGNQSINSDLLVIYEKLIDLAI